MASSTGMNRIGNLGGELLLSVSPSSTGNGLDSGICMTEAIGCKEFTFQLIGPGAQTAGYSVYCYGTIDQAAYAYGKPPGQSTVVYPNTPLQQTIVGQGKGAIGAVPATSWLLLPGPSEQSGTGAMSNPLVSGASPVLKIALSLVAVRVVAAVTGSPTSGVQVVCFATG